MNDREPTVIDHNRYELPNDTMPWGWCWAFVGFFWAVDLYRGDVEWGSVALGILTGMLLAAWAIVKTGGRVPESWRSPPRG